MSTARRLSTSARARRKNVGSQQRRRVGSFEILELRLLLSASSINGRPYIDLGPSDNVALDQPRVTVQLITPTNEVVGPDIFNDWLLDTGANTILTFQSAVGDMNSAPPRYETQGTFDEIGVGGSSLYDISKPYRFDFAGRSGERNTLSNTRIISDASRDLSLFGPFGIVGMPAMTQRVTTLDLTTLTDINEFSMRTDFSNTMPATTLPRYSVALDNRVSFDPEGSIVTGGVPPAWSDIPFMTGQLKHNDAVATGNMLFDTGAQVSILSSAMAIALGLDSNLDGVLDSKDANFAREETIGGIGGQITVPAFLIDELHLPTQQGPDLVWTDLQWLVLDIVDGIDAVFGFDNMTSGWIEAFFSGAQSGYIRQAHLDFRNWEATGNGSFSTDINPEIFSVVDPNGPGAIVVESGDVTTVSETGIADTYQLSLSKAPAANVRISLVAALGDQVRAVSLSNPANSFLDFTPTNWNVPQTVSVSAVNDSTAENFHRSFVRHVSSSTDPQYQNAGMPRVIVNVIDNDVAGLMIIPSEGATNVTEGGATDTYQVVLTLAPTLPVTIQFENTQNQVRAVAANGGASFVTFSPTNWNVPQTVLVTAVDDTLVEGAHKSYVTHRIETSDTGYQEAFALQELIFLRDNDAPDLVPPRVTDVIVGSSLWSAGFIDAVDGGGVGTGNRLGISLPGANQMKNLTQNNINKIYIKFSENVAASFASTKLAIVGTNRSNYMPLATLAYGVDGVDVATITLSSPLTNDALRLSILDTLTDAAGNRLDGEWVDGISTSSGNGSSNGQFNFRLDVLPGDVNDSNGVNSSDLLSTHSRNGTVVSSLSDASFDINGNGGVNSADLLLVSGRNGSVMPSAPAASSTNSAMGSGVELPESLGKWNGWISRSGILPLEMGERRPLDILIERSMRLRNVEVDSGETTGNQIDLLPWSSDLVPTQSEDLMAVLPPISSIPQNDSQFLSERSLDSTGRDLRKQTELLTLNLDGFPSSGAKASESKTFEAKIQKPAKVVGNPVVDQLIAELVSELDAVFLRLR
jgi:hypothetical protein